MALQRRLEAETEKEKRCMLQEALLEHERGAGEAAAALAALERERGLGKQPMPCVPHTKRV